jgi:hypothetical protein
MKIEEIIYKTYDEINSMSRFDLKEMPRKAKWYLRILSWILSFPETFFVKSSVNKVNMDGLKGGYIMLCNHNSFVDFKVATRAIFPRSSSYIVAIDGFIGREKLMRDVGCFPTRKFISDSGIVRQIKHSVEVNKQICQIYPEARYSLVGTTSILPDSLGKLCKLIGHPVVTLISHGHHLRQPFWNLTKRKVKSTSNMTQILTVDDLKSLSVEEINRKIRDAFEYDDYQYQLDNKIKIDFIDRAKNLHKVLYQCPKCKTEFEMDSDTNKIWCKVCNDTHQMDELGRLHNLEGETRFPHIPDWFEWQREMVKKEIASGKYHLELDVMVDMLPNSSGFYRIGGGKISHSLNGFILTIGEGSEKLEVVKSVKSNYGIHLEFDYFGRGDGFSFSTKDDTFYLYPENTNYSITKLHFAVEELYIKSTK